MSERAAKAVIKWYAPRQVWVCIDNLTGSGGVFASEDLQWIYRELAWRMPKYRLHLVPQGGLH